jgi:predicted MPP superfamily phosphohydrolase
MTKIKNLNPKDKKSFVTRSKFPGEEGNPFDRILRNLQKINQIPAISFFLIIVILSGIFSFFTVENWLLLFFFSVTDSLIIVLLPKLKISFGSYKSQVVLLLILRALFIWFSFPINLIFQILGSFLVLYGFIKEPSDIKITTIYHNFPKVSAQFNFFHISDIHLEQLGLREEKLLSIVENRKPDFILYTGDFLNFSNIRDTRAIENIIGIFNKIHSISPVYYVSGSPAVDVGDTIKIIENNLNPIRLNNSNIFVNHEGNDINIIGITCTHQPHMDIKQLPPLKEEGNINVLLYHSPDLVYELDAEDQIDLMLSGHTHGGQVRLPIFGAIFTGSLYGRKLQKGLYQMHDTLLYISRGIGLEGLGAPRIRFLCSPEIIEWKINS